MGLIAVVWSRIRNTSRMLGIIWVCERDMDTCGHYQLESGFDLEFCFHGSRFCGERSVSGQESVADC